MVSLVLSKSLRLRAGGVVQAVVPSCPLLNPGPQLEGLADPDSDKEVYPQSKQGTGTDRINIKSDAMHSGSYTNSSLPASRSRSWGKINRSNGPTRPRHNASSWQLAECWNIRRVCRVEKIRVRAMRENGKVVGILVPTLQSFDQCRVHWVIGISDIAMLSINDRFWYSVFGGVETLNTKEQTGLCDP